MAALDRREDQKSRTTNAHRPDIDGLRAIAVLSVVAFHAFPNYVRGGFVGVDVFFVISGFLISGIIFRSLDDDSFTFANFYSRRIKRIFPALIALLAACMAVGWFVLLGDEYKQLGKHVFGGMGFVSNIVLWKESGYFDTASALKPLLHLWSLGIEEQFYIVWPLLLFAAGKKKGLRLSMIGGLFLVSFVLNVAQVSKNPV
jgi:peptidoglycan/LPS O-acetylase OafA/YrhL